MNKSDLIDYLYAEMDEEKRMKFEALVEGDPNLLKELEELKRLRELLGSHADAQPTGTPIIFHKSASSNKGFYLKLMAVAASILIILFTGYMTDVSLSLGKGRVLFTFGEETLSEPAWQDLVAAELMNQQNAFTKELEIMRRELVNSIAQNQEGSGMQPARLTQELASFGNRIKKENQLWTANLLEDVSEQQNDKTEALLNQLLLYIDQRRTEDMEFVKKGFDQVVRSIYEQNPYQQLALLTISQ